VVRLLVLVLARTHQILSFVVSSPSDPLPTCPVCPPALQPAVTQNAQSEYRTTYLYY